MIVDASTVTLAELLDQVQDNEVSLLVSEGRAKAVLLSPATFEALTASLDEIEERPPVRLVEPLFPYN